MCVKYDIDEYPWNIESGSVDWLTISPNDGADQSLRLIRIGLSIVSNLRVAKNC